MRGSHAARAVQGPSVVLEFRQLASSKCNSKCTKAEGLALLTGRCFWTRDHTGMSVNSAASVFTRILPRHRAATPAGRGDNPKTFTLQTSGAGRQLRGRFAGLPPKCAQARPSTPAPPLPASIHTKARGCRQEPSPKRRAAAPESPGGSREPGLLTG